MTDGGMVKFVSTAAQPSTTASSRAGYTSAQTENASMGTASGAEGTQQAMSDAGVSCRPKAGSQQKRVRCFGAPAQGESAAPMGPDVCFP